jgi:hypothetical protein
MYAVPVPVCGGVQGPVVAPCVTMSMSCTCVVHVCVAQGSNGATLYDYEYELDSTRGKKRIFNTVTIEGGSEISVCKRVCTLGGGGGGGISPSVNQVHVPRLVQGCSQKRHILRTHRQSKADLLAFAQRMCHTGLCHAQSAAHYHNQLVDPRCQCGRTFGPPPWGLRGFDRCKLMAEIKAALTWSMAWSKTMCVSESPSAVGQWVTHSR